MSEPTPFNAIDWQVDVAIAHEVVLAAWLAHVDGKAPWRTMRPDDVLGYLRPITIGVLGAECDPDERRRMVLLHEAAVRHAAFRTAQRCDRRVIHRELAVLEAAIRAAIDESSESEECRDVAAALANAELRRVRRSIHRCID